MLGVPDCISAVIVFVITARCNILVYSLYIFSRPSQWDACFLEFDMRDSYGTWGSVGAQTRHVSPLRQDDSSVLDFCHSRLLLNLSLSDPMDPLFARDPRLIARDRQRRELERGLSAWLSAINDSRAYGNLAMELIFLCRFFVQAHEQSSNSFIRLRK
jgi:hypothetical protein